MQKAGQWAFPVSICAMTESPVDSSAWLGHRLSELPQPRQTIGSGTLGSNIPEEHTTLAP